MRNGTKKRDQQRRETFFRESKSSRQSSLGVIIRGPIGEDLRKEVERELQGID